LRHQLANLRDHDVELSPQASDLVIARNVHLDVEVAALDLIHRVDEALDRVGDAKGDEDRKDDDDANARDPEKKVVDLEKFLVAHQSARVGDPDDSPPGLF